MELKPVECGATYWSVTLKMKFPFSLSLVPLNLLQDKPSVKCSISRDCAVNVNVFSQLKVRSDLEVIKKRKKSRYVIALEGREYRISIVVER